MPLSPGTRLGPYDIVSALGAGGMGEVYRARDTRLDRSVAIKVLPAAIAGDPQARERFEREARAVAALNHPHICTLHDIGRHVAADGSAIDFLVLEHLEGETLAARLEKGPLLLDQALRWATEVAAALDRAHRAGIVHRDVKPANIMLTKAGAKLLDFGLAKLKAPATPISLSGMTQRATSPGTAQGTILGTIQYMAPEQVEGKEADARSDIWALGAVLYEMLTGTRPFVGDTPASVIGAILKDRPPPISTRQPMTPRMLDVLVARCLAKDQDERWQSIADVGHQLAAIASIPVDAGEVTPTTRSARISPWMLAAGVVGMSAVVAAVAIGVGARRPTESTERPSVRIVLDLGPDVSLTSDIPVVVLSPDGTRIVFVSTGPDRISRLSTRRLDQVESTSLPGTDGASAPFFAPDGMWVAFFAVGKLKKTRLDGGEPVVLVDAPAGRGGSWGEDGTIVAALDQRRGLSAVPSSGGAVSSLTELADGELTHRWPTILPGGKAVLFTVGSVPGNYSTASIAVAPLHNNPGKARRILLPNAGMAPNYLSSGHLVYVSNGTLYAVPFDVDRLEVRGTQVPVLEDLSDSVAFGTAQLTFSHTGAMLYRSGRNTGRSVVQWLAGNGKTESMWGEPAQYQYPKVSPDGSRLAVAVADGSNNDIWVYDWQRGSKTRLTGGPAVDSFPIWSPDGQHIVFQSAGQLQFVRADRAAPAKPLTAPIGRSFPTTFTPDGRQLLFYEIKPGGGSLIKSMSVDMKSGTQAGREPELVREVTAGNPVPAVSPDGRWIAYAATDSGPYEVYVRAFPDNGRQWPVSAGGGNYPVWSRTRQELFYRTEDQFLMVTPYTVVGDDFIPDKPRRWSDTRLFDTGLTQNFDLAPDGQRFAVLLAAEGPEHAAAGRQMILVLNFFDEVRRRVAGGR
jgi:serine/threonine protein kinase